MKLSTKTLFTSIKDSPKRKFKNIQKRKIAVIEGPKNSSKSNNFYCDRNERLNLFLNKTTVNENPFKKPKISIRRPKSKILPKKMSYNNKKKDMKILKKEALIEDSYINNILLGAESEPNKYKLKNGKKNTDINSVEQNLDDLCDLFWKSNYKSTVIIENKEYNNLDLGKKNKIVDKKNIYSSNKNKVNSNIVKKYNENNNVFKKKTSLNDMDKIKKNLFGTNNDKKQNLDNFNFKIHKSSKNTNSINTNMFRNYLLLTKEKTTKNIIIGEHDNIISGKEKSEIKDNSLFETFANNSDDSSFLSSSPFD